MTSPAYRLSRGLWFGFNGIYEFRCNENNLAVRRTHKGLLFVAWRVTEARFPYDAVRLAGPDGGKRVQLKLGDHKQVTFVARTTEEAQAFQVALTARLPAI